MLATRLLRGVPVTRFGAVAEVFVAPHGREPGRFRYVASRDDGEAHKARIFALLARQGRPELPEEWAFHPLVEPEHLADVDFHGALAAQHADAIPWVLLHEAERRAVERTLHRDAPDAPLPEGAPARARAVAQRTRLTITAYADPRKHSALRARVRGLATRYRDAYDGDRVLQRLVQNLFDDALALLR
jgi:hypothetical protein